MLVEEYIEHCFRSWNYSPSKEQMIINASLGIIGEAGELVNSSNLPNANDEVEPPIGECGDLLYYCCVTLKLLHEYYLVLNKTYGVDNYISNLYLTAYEHVYNVPDHVMYNAACQLAELNKKVFFHHKDGYNYFNWVEKIDRILMWLFFKMSNEYNLTLHDVMNYNVNKLQKRYENGFVPG